MKLISLHNEVKFISELLSDTIILIHHTFVIDAIKKLISAHDILNLTIILEKQYEEYKCQPPWNLATSKSLDSIRCGLITNHSDSFKPPELLTRYYIKIGKFLEMMSVRIVE